METVDESAVAELFAGAARKAKTKIDPDTCVVTFRAFARSLLLQSRVLDECEPRSADK